MQYTAEFLKQFCGTDKFATPWSYGNWTVACNRHVLVRVPRIDGIGEDKTKPDLSSRYEIGKTLESDPENWVQVPLTKLKSEKCTKCQGTGHVYRCPECDGSGEVELSTDYNDYGEYDCISCDGQGVVSKATWEKLVNSDSTPMSECEKCQGTGKVCADINIKIGLTTFSARMLNKIASLPNVMIAPTTPLAVAKFRFYGGDGVVMPIRT